MTPGGTPGRAERGTGAAGTARPAPEERFSEIRFLHFARVLVYAAAVGLAWSGAEAPGGEVRFLAVLGAQVLLAGVWTLLLRRGATVRSLLTLEFLVDAVFVTLLVSWTGGAVSPYSLLYLFLIVGAGSLEGVGGGVTFAVVASAGYLITAFGSGGVVGSYLGGSPFEDEAILRAFARLSFYPVFFVCVGTLAGFVGDRSREKAQALARARSEIEQMRVSADVIVENLSSGLLTVDAEGRVLLMNRMGEAMTGLDKEAIRGTDYRDALGEGGRELSGRIRVALEEGRAESRREILYRAPGAPPKPVGISTSLLRTEGDGTAGVVAIFQDLTEVRKAEERARQQDRLAAIGELATGIAHEIRNCLNPIAGSVDLLRRELVLSAENRKLMDLIHRETETLDGFVRQLLSYARGRALRIASADVPAFLEEVVSLVRNHPGARDRVRVRSEAPPGGLEARLDEEQMRQVLLNLCLNAVEAMPSGGELVLSAGASAEGETWIDVRDTGGGIPESVLPHIFEPFYTTKSGGTGLGLAIAHRIVEKHGGRLEVKSVHGSGTTVRIRLPEGEPAGADETAPVARAA